MNDNIITEDDLEQMTPRELIDMIFHYNSYVTDCLGSNKFPSNFMEFINSDIYETIYKGVCPSSM